MVSLDDIHENKCLKYVERLVANLDRKTKFMRKKVVPLVKVLVVAPEGLRVALGARGGDIQALPKSIYDYGFKIRNKIQVDENCNIYFQVLLFRSKISNFGGFSES